jgi:4-amino-4-deoxy-L-arabinose transferase-like glycosyltransferase
MVDNPIWCGCGPAHRIIHSFAGLLFLSALVIRIVCLAATYKGENGINYFEDVGIAFNILEGRGYSLDFTRISPTVQVRSTAAKPPIYPLLVVLVFSVFGTAQFLALFIVHALLAASTCVLLYLSLVRFSHYTAAITAGLFAVYPPFAYHSVTVAESTTLTLFVISTVYYALLKVHARPAPKRWISASALGGLLALTEPVTIPFILLAFTYIAYLAQSSLKDITLQLSVALFTFTMTIAPWTLRNYLTFNKVVFIKSSFGSSLKDSLGGHVPKDTYFPLRKAVQGMDEVNEDRAISKAIFAWIVANPLTYAGLLPQHFLKFWWETERYKDNRTTQYILGRKLPYIGLLVLSLPTLFLALGRLGWTKLRENTHIEENLMLLLIVTYTAVYTLVGAWNMRYHFPVELAMFVFAAATIAYIGGKSRVLFNLSLNVVKADL